MNLKWKMDLNNMIKNIRTFEIIHMYRIFKQKNTILNIRKIIKGLIKKYGFTMTFLNHIENFRNQKIY